MVHPRYNHQNNCTTNQVERQILAPAGGNTMIYNQTSQMTLPQDVNLDESWFWLNTSAEPPHWTPLKSGNGGCINRQLTPRLTPRHFDPFHLLYPIYTEYCTISRIYLLDEVDTPMAIDCDAHIPLIFIPKCNQRQQLFGYSTVQTAHVQIQKETKSKPKCTNTNEKPMTKDQWQRSMKSRAQQILFLNQKIRTKRISASAAGKWYCFGIGSDPHMWYPFDCSISKRIDYEYYEAKEPVLNSFLVNGTTACLQIELPANAYFVNIPYGFARIVYGNTEESFLIIRCQFPCDPMAVTNFFEVSPSCWPILGFLGRVKLENTWWQQPITSRAITQSEWQQALEADACGPRRLPVPEKDDLYESVLYYFGLESMIENEQRMDLNNEEQSICYSEQKEIELVTRNECELVLGRNSLQLSRVQRHEVPVDERKDTEGDDFNEWLGCLFYNGFEIWRLKYHLQSIITEENITSAKLLELGIIEFTTIVRKRSGSVMSVAFTDALYLELTHKAHISHAPCDEICEQSVAFIDRWCKEKKEALKKRCTEIDNDSLDVRSFDEKENHIVFDYKSLEITIRICTDNDIRNKNTTFAEWLLNILEDKEEFNIKMNKLKEYVTEFNVNAAALIEQIPFCRRKHFVNTCYRKCGIARCVANDLYIKLIQETQTRCDMAVDDVYKFMEVYLEEVCRSTKTKMIARIKQSKMGKSEFVKRYAYGQNPVSKISDFLRCVMDYKNKHLLNKLSHRIYACIGLMNCMYSIPSGIFLSGLTTFDQECTKYDSILNELQSESFPNIKPHEALSPKHIIDYFSFCLNEYRVNTLEEIFDTIDEHYHEYKEEEFIAKIIKNEENLNNLITKTLRKWTVNKEDNVISFIRSHALYDDDKDIRELIPEYIYPWSLISEQMYLVKCCVLKHNIDGDLLCRMQTHELYDLMENECKIPWDVTCKFLLKCFSLMNDDFLCVSSVETTQCSIYSSVRST